MLVFDPAKRISVVDALAHPYLEEGRLRYHSCMCKCCYSAPAAARHYSPDLEPAAPHAFHDAWERKLTSVHQVKGTTHASAPPTRPATDIAHPLKFVTFTAISSRGSSY